MKVAFAQIRPLKPSRRRSFTWEKGDANALRQANERVKTHDELFPQDTPDETWLNEAGRQGWIVFTKDTRIRYHANEIAAILNSKVRAFVLTARGDLTGREMAAIFIKALPAIKRMAGEIPAPFIARIQRDGSVEILRRATGG